MLLAAPAVRLLRVVATTVSIVVPRIGQNELLQEVDGGVHGLIVGDVFECLVHEVHFALLACEGALILDLLHDLDEGV